jgi:pimeloyl-ACP methyl ester carboxylesterase
MNSFQRDGVRFSYADTGSGTPFVFQHGLGGDASQPAAQAPKGVRLITLECRGHGQTQALGRVDRLGFATFARDLDALLDRLSLDEVVLGGISMGAGVALALARLRPGRARALVLVRPAWTNRRSPPHLRVFQEIGALLREHPPGTAKDIFVSESVAYRQIRSRSPAAAASLVAQFDRPRSRRSAPVFQRLPADRPVARFPRSRSPSIPTLVLGARHDPIHPFDCAVFLRLRLPGAILEEIPPKDPDDRAQRQAVAHAIGEFLADLAVAEGAVAGAGARR